MSNSINFQKEKNQTTPLAPNASPRKLSKMRPLYLSNALISVFCIPHLVRQTIKIQPWSGPVPTKGRGLFYDGCVVLFPSVSFLSKVPSPSPSGFLFCFLPPSLFRSMVGKSPPLLWTIKSWQGFLREIANLSLLLIDEEKLANNEHLIGGYSKTAEDTPLTRRFGY